MCVYIELNVGLQLISSVQRARKPRVRRVNLIANKQQCTQHSIWHAIYRPIVTTMIMHNRTLQNDEVNRPYV